MDIKKAVKIVDEAPCFPGSAQQREAWQTLKEFVLAQLSHNTGSPKCLCETCQNAYCEGLYPTVNVKAKYIVHECNGFTKSLSHNTGMLADAQICQNIVEDQLDYLIRIGLDFKEGEKDCVRDNLYRIVAGKLQHT